MQAEQEQRKLLEESDGNMRVMKRHASGIQERSIEAEEVGGGSDKSESDESEEVAHYFQVPLQVEEAAPARRRRGARKLLSIEGCEFGDRWYMSGEKILSEGCFNCFCNLNKPQCQQDNMCNLENQKVVITEEQKLEALLVGRDESRYGLAKHGFSAAKRLITQREHEIIGGIEHIIENEQNLRETNVFEKIYEKMLNWIKQIEDHRFYSIMTYTQQLTAIRNNLINNEF